MVKKSKLVSIALLVCVASVVLSGAAAAAEMVVIRADEGTVYDAPGHFNFWGIRKFGPDDGSLGLSVSNSEFLPNGGADMSSSPRERIYFVLRGAMVVTGDDGKIYNLEEGDMIYIPPGVSRDMAVTGIEAAITLVIVAPVPENAGEPAKEMTVVKANEGIVYEAPGHFNFWGIRKFGPDDGSLGLSVSNSEFLPHGGADMSSSPRERIYLIERGAMTVTGGDGKVYNLEEGDMIYIPPGVSRDMATAGIEACRTLVMVLPVP